MAQQACKSCVLKPRMSAPAPALGYLSNQSLTATRLWRRARAMDAREWPRPLAVGWWRRAESPKENSPGQSESASNALG